MHAAKGLEFPVVFIVALEEGLLPHERSRHDNDMIEEERRLLFVGITRAREELHLTHATYREFRGVRRRTVPSHFLMELPRGEMDVVAPEIVVFEPHHGAGDDVHDDAHEDGLDDSFDPQALESQTVPWETASDELAESMRSSPERTAPATAAVIGPLATAADLHDESTQFEPGHFSPELFHQGMIVRHPEYGLGKIMALSGSGDRRSATVAFASSARQKKFVLAKSPLRPAKSS